ncbi:hypothetical protein [Aquimarina muelleri]|uniref:Uncharacterized protein n=1 Tax=Aquimarina muelleri TaxID=279356 RepID=A0A918JU67_9FLAO|nr:hypothetical protein [Aquimarina muelleri]MCX2761892.1 hypothetical protein [Aquimarina muelleri]GGX10141.1 hypothetical protein GCM10007384_09830 [Aquimarina muelleri]
MKFLIKVFVILLILVSCKKETEKKLELSESNFKLKQDFTDFKEKMTELDTIKVWFNHSVCAYQAYEQLEITKSSDLIKIHSEFMESTFNDNPEWKVVYNKEIPINDTLWRFEKFVNRNKKWQNSDVNSRGTLYVVNKEDTIRFSVSGLVDLNRFISDYYRTMRKLYPENKGNIYGMNEIKAPE